MRKWPLIAVAIAAFVLTLLLFLPATLIARWLPPNVTTGTLSGTLWNGGADAITIGGRFLGAARWQVLPLQLFSGRLALDLELVRPDGVARGRCALGLGNKIECSNVEAHWPIGELPMRVLPPGWTGDVQIAAPTLRLDNGALTGAAGTIEVLHLREPPRGLAIGSYQLAFAEGARQGDKTVGQIKDLEGPMEVSGTLTLGDDRSYVIDGLVAARAGAPRGMVERLRYLGAPDAQGRRPFSVAGTY